MNIEANDVSRTAKETFEKYVNPKYNISSCIIVKFFGPKCCIYYVLLLM